MRVETAEWVEKAEGDWHTAGRELKATEFPNYDAVCFHAQQCADAAWQTCGRIRSFARRQLGLGD
jgi:HEPN domain-containing protein